jgi:hypothetical protein
MFLRLSITAPGCVCVTGLGGIGHTGDDLAGDRIMKPIRAILIASVLAGLGGCMVVPVNPGYYGPPVYAAPAPVYYGAQAYYGPSVGFGIYGGGRGYGRGYRYR